MKKTTVLTTTALTIFLALGTSPAAVAQNSETASGVQLSTGYASKYASSSSVQSMAWVCRIIPCKH